MINQTYRKLNVSILGIACTMIALASADAKAQDAAATEVIEKAVKDRISVKAKWVKSDALGKVIAGKLYDVTIRFGDKNGSQSFKEKALMIGGKVTSIPSPTTNEKLPDLLKLINKNFRLKSDDDVAAFQDTLDAIYPIRFDKKVKTIKTDGNKTIFVRGKFFDDLKGFVVTKNTQGVITDISYSLEIK